MSLGKAVLEITTDNKGLDAGVGKVETALDRLKRQAGVTSGGIGTLKTALSGIGAAVGIGFGVGAVVSFGRAIFDSAGNVVDLANKLGVSTDFVQRLQFVSDQAGGSVEQFADAAFKLGVNIEKGNAGAVASLEALGLKYADIRAMKPEQQFDAVARALGTVTDQQTRNRLGVDLLGKGYANIASAIGEYRIHVDRATVVQEDAIRALDEAADAAAAFWDSLWKGAQRGVGEVILQIQKLREEKEKLGPAVTGRASWLTGVRPEEVEDVGAASRDLANTLAGSYLNATKGAGLATRSFATELETARQEVLTLTPEVRAEIDAALKLGHAMEDIPEAFNLSTTAQKLYTSVTKEATSAQRQGTAAAAAYAKELQLGADVLTGKKVAAEIELLGKQVALAARQGGILASEWPKLVVQVEALANAGLPLGKTLDAIITPTRTMAALGPLLAADMSALTAGLQTVNPNWKTFAEFVGLAGINMAALVTTELPDFSKLGKAIELAVPPSLGEILGKNLEQGLFGPGGFTDRLGPTLMHAFTSEASVADEIGKLFGAQIGKALSDSLSSTLESQLGDVLGGALGSFLPGIGGFLGSALGDGIDALIGHFTQGARTNDLRDLWMAQQGGFMELQRQIGLFNNDAGLMASFGKIHHAGQTDDFEAAAAAFEARLRTLQAAEEDARRLMDSTISRLGLGLKDRDLAHLTTELPQAMAALLKETDDLIAAGYDHDAVIKAQAESYEDFFTIAKKFNIDIPAGFKAVLADLAGAGLLMDEVTAAQSDKLKARMASLDSELMSLQQMVAEEQPEEVMGIIEAQARARIAEIEKEKRTIQDEIEELTMKLTASFGEAAVGMVDAVANAFKDLKIEIPIAYLPGPMPGPGSPVAPYTVPALASGGVVTKNTLAHLHASEAVIPLDRLDAMMGGGGAPIYLSVNAIDAQSFQDFLRRGGNRVIAEGLIDELRRHGLVR